MATVIKYKQRLNSVQSTKKITKAMELVSSAKLGKARQNAQNVRFFRQIVHEAMSHVSQHRSEIMNKYLDQREIKTIAYIVIGSDLGLCGPYNMNIVKQVSHEIKDDHTSKLYVLGNKVIDKLKFDGIQVHKEFRGIVENWSMDQINDLATSLLYDYANKKIDKICLVYTKYVNPIEQIAVCESLLPVDEKIVNTKPEKISANTIIEPGEEELLNQLIPQYFVSYVHAAYLESIASEFSYRRNAMENANKNASELIDDLVLQINRIRQANITQEISEIVSGSEAQKGK
jgi:F-type H+-transporting ATPase subunit gamma